MAEVTLTKTFKNIPVVSNWVTFTKAAADDTLVVPEYGVSSANITVNGVEETIEYGTHTLTAAPTAQADGVLTLATADATALSVGGYVWNVTKGEIVLVRDVVGTNVYVSRGLFGTGKATWAISDVCILLRVLTLASTSVGKGLGEYTPMPDIGIGQDLL